MARPKFSLNLKIFLGTAFVVSAVLLVGLALTSRSANRAAQESIQRALTGTRQQVEDALEARGQTLMSIAVVFAQPTTFVNIVDSRSTANAFDQSNEAADRLKANWVQITDREGIRLAKSDEAGAASDTLAQSGLISGALKGKSVTAYGGPLSGDTVFQAVSVPFTRPGASVGTGTVVGVLMATKYIDSTFLASVKSAADGKTEVVVYGLDNDNAPHVAASTLARTDELRRTIGAWRPEGDAQAMAQTHDDIVLDGKRYVRMGAPFLSAGGTQVGGFLALRSRDAELAPFRALQRTILIAGAGGLLIAFLLSFVIARQITKPVESLAIAARKAADGDYGTEIAVTSKDEIGTLAQAFRTLLADLRDKQALVDILQGGAGDARTVQIDRMGATVALAAAGQGITPGTTLAKRYHVKEILGVGGMGTVFKALDAELDELVAIKTLKQDLLSQDPTALERFKGEIRLARRISHRNVVRTHDLGEVDGVYFISMEYVEGKSLKDLIRARGRLPVAATVTIGKQLLRALEVAHEQGVIHRDVKPQNVVVTPDGVLKVMDFGIARLAVRTKGVTQAGMVIGTPEYMAPEQLLGDDIDARADLYAAGVVLYECLTGNTPFNADSAIALIGKVLEEIPASPRVTTEIPSPLADLVLRALDKDPAKRPQTATEFHDALAAFG